MIKAVIFDLDGTLKEFNLDTKTCRTKVISFLTQKGFSRDLFSMNETAFDMLKKVNEILKAKNAKPQEFEMFKAKIFSIVENMEFEAAKKSEPFAGVPETLTKLKSMNLLLGLCTISGEKVTRYFLERFNIEHFFDVVITRDSVLEVKPHPEQLQAALDTLQVKPQEAVLVGDSIKDVACARQLNVIAVGVTTGLSSTEKLTNAGAHYIASSVNDIPTLILQLKTQF